MADITAILQATQSHDANARVAAEAQLKAAQESNFPGFLTSLAGEIANEQKPPTTRPLAGLLLKNSLDARDENRKAELVEKWLQQDPTIRNQIKGAVWNTLSSSDPTVRHTSAQVVAKIAGAEIPAKQWPDLVQNLQNNVSNGTAPGLKQATLEALGFVCEEIDAEHLEEAEVNAMLTAIVQGMRKEEPDVEIRLAACVALRNALYFAVNNFEHDNERNYIMQVTCEATVCDDVRVRVAAYEVLVGVAENYYQHLQPYMTAIFDLSVKATKSDDETVALQAIEFWSAICEEEIDRQEEIDDANTAEAAAAVAYHRFIEKALPMLVPMLLETLTKQDEDQVDDGDDAWNVAMAGGTCLRLVATCVQDAVVDHVMPFIQQNISQGEWRLREAATYAFGSILEGPDPDKLAPVASQALPFLLNAMKDQMAHVRDTTAWTVGRVFEYVGQVSDNVPPVVSAANLEQILKPIVESLQDRVHVAGKSCWALQRLFACCAGEDDHDPMRAALAPYFQGIVQALIAASERADAEQTLRIEAYESLNEIIRASTRDTYSLVQQLIPMVMQKLGVTLDQMAQPGVSAEAAEKLGEIQGLLCGTLQTIVQKLSADGDPATTQLVLTYADNIMQCLLRVIGARSATVHEEAMLCVGALAYASGAGFEKYMTALYPFIDVGLKNHEEYEVCNVTVGVVGDLCRALEEKMLPYCDGIVTQLLQDLQSTQLHRSVKPPILSCFGDIALAVGVGFEKYLPYVVPMLQSATQLSISTPKTDEEMIDYNNMLRSGIFEAYAGLLQGFKNDKSKVQQLVQHASFVVAFVEEVYKDEDRDEAVTRAMIGVLGDMADMIDGMGAVFQQHPFWQQLLAECSDSHQDAQLQETAQWAGQKIRAVCGM
jgi:importin subunit beta-1